MTGANKGAWVPLQKVILMVYKGLSGFVTQQYNQSGAYIFQLNPPATSTPATNDGK